MTQQGGRGPKLSKKVLRINWKAQKLKMDFCCIPTGYKETVYVVDSKFLDSRYLSQLDLKARKIVMK